MTLPTHKAFEVDPKLVLEVASGLEEPAAIALRYGLDQAAWEQLSTWPPFVNEVAAKKAELEKSGYTFKMKAHLLADDLLGDVYLRAKGHDTALSLKLETLKLLSKLADLEPKNTNVGQIAQGGGFSITISLPPTSQPLPPYLQDKPIEVIDVIEVPVREAE